MIDVAVQSSVVAVIYLFNKTSFFHQFMLHYQLLIRFKCQNSRYLIKFAAIK